MNLTEKVSALKYGGKDLEFPKFPVRFDLHESAHVEEPPLLGEHSEQILREMLQYSDVKIA